MGTKLDDRQQHNPGQEDYEQKFDHPENLGDDPAQADFDKRFDDIAGQDTDQQFKDIADKEIDTSFKDIVDRNFGEAERQPKPVNQVNDTNLGSREQNPAKNEPAGAPFTLLDEGPAGKEKGGKGRGGRFGSRKKKIGFAVGAGGGVGILLAGIMGGSILFKGPLLSGFVNKVFGETVEYIVETRIRAFALAWMSRDLFEGARRCGSTVHLNCVDKSLPKAPSGLLGTYITVMQKRKVHHELAARGITIERITKEAGVHAFRIVSPEGAVEVDDNGNAIQRWKEQEIKNPRAALREIKGLVNTHIYGFLRRIVALHVLKRGLGLKMCVSFCSKDDNDKLRAREAFRERRVKYYNAQTATIGRRMIDQASVRQSILLKCLLGPCKIEEELRRVDSEEARRLLSDPNQFEELERDGRRMNALSERTGGRTRGLARLGMQRILAKLAGEQAARTTTAFAEKTIGPAGLAILAVMITFSAGEIVDWYRDYSGDHKARKLWDQTKMAFNRGAFNQVNTGSDEMFGAQYPEEQLDLATVAASNERLNGVEKAPAYPYMIGSLSNAQNTQKGAAQCTGNGEQPPEPEDGQIYCQNDRYGEDPPWKRKYDATGDMVGPFKYIRDILPGGIYIYSLIFGRLQGKILANIEEFIIDIVFDNAAGNAALGVLKDVVSFVTNLPGIKQVVDTAGEKLYDALASFFMTMFPMPAVDPSQVKGAVYGTAMMLGADATYKDYARGGKDQEGQVYGLGAPQVSAKQANEFLGYLRQQELEERKYASVRERFFSMNTDSLFARILLNEHTAAFSSPQNLAITSFNPFSTLLGSVTSLFTARTSAANPIQRATASGLPANIYLPSDPLLVSEPTTLTPEECAKVIDEGFKEDGIDDHGRAKFKTTPEAQKCMLDTAAVTLGVADSDPEQKL